MKKKIRSGSGRAHSEKTPNGEKMKPMKKIKFPNTITKGEKERKKASSQKKNSHVIFVFSIFQVNNSLNG
jgi:hypothetical protein